MRAELYIMRCKIDYLEALKENLEKFAHNRNIEIVEKADIVINVFVYEGFGTRYCVLKFDGINTSMGNFSFEFQ